jgi:hypothetical protein
MTQRCQVCDSEHRARIELALSKRVSYDRLAKKFGLSRDAIGRHRRNHMPTQLMAALQAYGKPTGVDMEALKQTESEGLLQTVAAQRARLWSAVEVCEEMEDWNASARFHGQLTANLNLTAKILGEIETGNRLTINQLVVSSEYLTLRSALVRALSPYPEARRAVSEVLRQLEGEQPHITGIPANAEPRPIESA